MEPTEQQQQQVSSPPRINKQLYVNSKLAELFEESGPTNPSEGFFNPLAPNLAVLHEKPHHRLLILLKMSGRTNREIAAESGYTEPWLSQIFRQPWAQATMAKISAEAGAQGIRGLLQSECIPSIVKLSELRDDPETPKAVVKSACDSLIQQYLGKPAQQVTVIEDKFQRLDAEGVAELDAEIAKLKAEEKQLLGHN